MRWLRWAFLGYAAVLAAVAWSMVAARGRAIERLSSPQSVAEWQAWRDDVRQQQSGHAPAPVQRRVPKSSEPPALVLMRDYFAVCLFGAVLFSTALYWVTAWFIAGVLARNK